MSDIGASLVDKLPWSKQLKSLVPELSQSMGPNPRVNLPLHARPPQVFGLNYSPAGRKLGPELPTNNHPGPCPSVCLHLCFRLRVSHLVKSCHYQGRAKCQVAAKSLISWKCTVAPHKMAQQRPGTPCPAPSSRTRAPRIRGG